MARRLERGQPGGPFARLASRTWASAMRVERPLHWREGAVVIAVGGSTLGGSGKTPLAIACAERLRGYGARVALVGHAYGAEPGRARLVSGEDDVRTVGDEALECARRLAAHAVPVVVAKTRQRALDLALEVADVAVVDGLCQARPRRASLSLLAVDARAPWGAGRCPPEGDLRAPPGVLLAAADRVVTLGTCGEERAVHDFGRIPVDHVSVGSRGAWHDGRLLGWDELARLRVGLWTAIARPNRVVHALERRGVRPAVVVHGGDHRPPAFRPAAGLDLWLCTPKCRAHLVSDERDLATLDQSLEVGTALEKVLEALCPS
jgi:tetraacyldisaccharide 4'-kinase